MTRFKDLGRAVEVETGKKIKRIPAVNIQVEDIPDGYGIYFEIFFENGNLWVVEQDISGNDRRIYITEQIDWAHNQDLCSHPTSWLDTWDEFLGVYESACA